MPKTGGRQKGTPNKKTVERRTAEAAVPAAKARASGRRKGTPNKKTAARIAATEAAVLGALGLLTAGQISAMSALEMMEYAAIQAALAGRWVIAAELAARVAPYRFAKLAPVSPTLPTEDLATQAQALHRLLIEMDATVGADTTLGPAAET